MTEGARFRRAGRIVRAEPPALVIFENRSTEYSRASTEGSWEDVWAPSIGADWSASPAEAS